MSDLPLPSEIAGRYRPLRLVGRGGMGVVYEVEHIHTGKRLALKLLTLHPGASTERFKREARAASLIESDHIVRVTDADVATELGGAPFLVMELLRGANLETVTAGRRASPEDVIQWLRQVARGLSKAHDAGIVHRDLKPENLFLTTREDGSPLVKILDFGIAKMTAEGTPLTASDAFVGTPGFMAPEQTDSQGPPVTFKADLFALGLIAFKLLMGRTYWNSGTLVQLLAQILAEPMPPASARGSSLGPGFDAWFARSCDRDPAKRFASVREQVEALAEALGLPAESTQVASGGAVTRESVFPLVQEGQPTSSLNGSISDLMSTQRRLGRRGLVGSGIAAVVVVAALALALARNAPAKRGRPPVDSVGLAGVLSLTPNPTPPAAPSSLPEPDTSGPRLSETAPSPASKAPPSAAPTFVAPVFNRAASPTPQRAAGAATASTASASVSAPPSALPQPSASPSGDPLLRLRRL